MNEKRIRHIGLSNCFRTLLILLLLTVTTGIVVAREWTPADEVFSGVPNPSAISIHCGTLGFGHLLLKYSSPNIRLETVTGDDKEWTYVGLNGEARIWETGKPSLPAIIRAIRLPNKGNVSVRIRNVKYHELNNIAVLPQQLVLDTLPDYKDFSFDDKSYRNNSWYPEENFRVGEPAIMRDARIASLAFYPVQYNPVSKILRIYDEWEAEIVPIGGSGLNEITTNPKPVPSFAPLYREILGADDLVLDNLNAPPGQILIISSNDNTVLSTIQPFIDWKIASGHPVQLTTRSSWNLTSDIYTAILNTYNNANPPLESVLLIGEGGTSGSLYLPSYNTASLIYTDHTYGLLAGSDILADVAISRFSTSSISTLQTMMNRSINFEKNPQLTDTLYYTSGWGYAGTSHNVLSNRTAVQFMLEMMRHRGITNTRYDEHGTNVDYSLIQQATAHTILWAHRAAWVGELNPANFMTFLNPNRPFVSLNMTCGSGDWYGDGVTGIHESLTYFGSPSIPTGALCGMSTEGHATHSAPNNVIATGVYYGFGVNNAVQPGPMYLEGKFQLWRTFQFSSPSDVTDFSNWNNVMGDITPKIWTGIPRRLLCTVPASIPVGQSTLRCTILNNNVPVPQLLVTAWKKNSSGSNETYIRLFTDSSGVATIPLTNRSAGRLFLTITGPNAGQNYIPIVDTINVIGTPVNLQLSSVSILDDTTNGRTGNSDHILNPGEVADLSICLANRSGTTDTSIVGTIHSLDARVTLSDSVLRWNSLAPSDSGLCILPIRLHLNTNYNDNEIVSLPLTVTTEWGTVSFTVPLTIRSLALTMRAYQLSGVSALTPGVSTNLTITIRNNGGYVPSSATDARLVSLNPNIIVTRNTVSFPALPYNSDVSNDSSNLWSLSTTLRLDPGSVASVIAIFTNGTVIDSLPFTLPMQNVGTNRPTGPDRYGYRAFDISDLSYPYAPVYNWVEIINTSRGQRLALSDTAVNLDTSVAIRLPFSVQCYGIKYDSLTICSNGWVAFGKQPVYSNFRNLHLPASEGPRNLVAVYWEDLIFSSSGTQQGVYIYHDTLQHQFVVTWRTVTAFGAGANEFQILIKQQDYYPTPTGDAPLQFQYKSFHNIPGDFHEPDYATIGIADNERQRALEYTYGNSYSTGSSSIPNSNTANAAILFTTAPADSFLHLFAPNGRDSMQVGIPYHFGWGGRTGMSNVNIEVKRQYPTGVWERILSNVSNNGNSTWTPTTPTTSNARFRIMSPDSTDGDTSATVVIRQGVPTLHVVHNTDTLLWTIGYPISIDWTGILLSGTVSIQLNRNYPTGMWETLFGSVIAASNHTVWNATAPVTSSARFRIVLNEITGIGDTSGVVSIVTPAQLIVTPNPIVQLVTPGDTAITAVSVTNSGGAPFTGTVTPNCGVDGFTYIHSTDLGGPRYQWVEGNSSGGITTGVDRINGPFSLPFNFLYYGQIYNSVWIGTNGWISFTNPNGNVGGANQRLPYTQVQAFLAVFWDHLSCPTNSIKTTFTSSVVIVSWANVQRYTQSTSNINFEVMLYPDGSIFYQYGSITVSDTSTDVAMQSADHTQYFNLYHHVSIPQQHAIRFYYNQRWAVPLPVSFTLSGGGSRNILMYWNAFGHANGDSLYGSIFLSGNENLVQATIPVRMYVHVVSATEGNRDTPKQFTLSPCYPNPFNPETSIEFQLEKAGLTKLEVYDISGRLVKVLLNSPVYAGSHKVHFNGSELPSGLYIYRLRSGNLEATRKMLLMK